MTTVEQIAQIDAAIDANRRALITRLHFAPRLSAREWQRAWDRCPDLRQREDDLYRQRGIAQQERDAAERKAWLSQKRKERAKFQAEQRQLLKYRAQFFASRSAESI